MLESTTFRGPYRGSDQGFRIFRLLFRVHSKHPCMTQSTIYLGIECILAC